MPNPSKEPPLKTSASMNEFLRQIEQRDPLQPEFLQAVREVMMSLWPFLEKLKRAAISLGLLMRNSPSKSVAALAKELPA